MGASGTRSGKLEWNERRDAPSSPLASDWWPLVSPRPHLHFPLSRCAAFVFILQGVSSGIFPSELVSHSWRGAFCSPSLSLWSIVRAPPSPSPAIVFLCHVRQEPTTRTKDLRPGADRGQSSRARARARGQTRLRRVQVRHISRQSGFFPAVCDSDPDPGHPAPTH